MKVFKLIVAIIVMGWSIGYFIFLDSVKYFSLDKSTLSDVVIIFGGKKQHLYTGAQLVKLGYSPYMFVTGDKPFSEYIPFLKSYNIAEQHFIFNVDFAHEYKDYALEASMFMRQNKFKSARIVADSSQIARAMIEIRSHVSIDTLLVPHPVSLKGSGHVKLFIEYNKFVFIYLSNILGFASNISLVYT